MKGKVEANHVWEVRHAGLLGIKYEVAVRCDLIAPDSLKVEKAIGQEGRVILKDVVDAAVLGCVCTFRVMSATDQ